MCSKVTDDEQVTRYIFSRSHFSSKCGRVKYQAYLPAPNGKSSVYRTSGLSDNEIWDIGQIHVANPTNRNLHAKGECKTKVFRNAGLDIVPDTVPHQRHANIVNWPSDKAKRLELAVEISNEAELTVSP